MSEIETQQHDEMNCVQDERLKAIDKKLNSISNIEQIVKNIQMGVIGNRDLGIEGLVGKQERQQTEIETNKKSVLSIKRLIYIGYGIGLAFLLIWNIYQGVK